MTGNFRGKRNYFSRNWKLNCALGLALFGLKNKVALASELMPTVPRRIERTQPDDTALQITSERQRELDAVEKELKEKRRAFESGQPPATTITPAAGQPSGATFPEPSTTMGDLDSQAQIKSSGIVKTNSGFKGAQKKLNSLRNSKGAIALNPRSSQKNVRASTTERTLQSGTPLQVFGVSQGSVENFDQNISTVLPTGSHVKARIVSGVEANAREPYPVLLQLDYAFTGPNKTRIDLSHCFMIAKARANLSTERVMMETENLSCVGENGEHFKSDAKAFVAGSDNTFGATGTYISKQGQVLLAAVLASIAKNAGSAIAEAQKTTSIFGSDKAATAANVTGSKAAFVAGSSMIDGGAMVAQWYLEQAKELLPSIGVGSGQDVFVVMLETIKIPQIQTEE